jgi:hypothetical protein
MATIGALGFCCCPCRAAGVLRLHPSLTWLLHVVYFMFWRWVSVCSYNFGFYMGCSVYGNFSHVAKRKCWTLHFPCMLILFSLLKYTINILAPIFFRAFFSWGFRLQFHVWWSHGAGWGDLQIPPFFAASDDVVLLFLIKKIPCRSEAVQDNDRLHQEGLHHRAMVQQQAAGNANC